MLLFLSIFKLLYFFNYLYNCTGEEAFGDGGPRASVGRPGHAQQRARTGNSPVQPHAPGGRPGRGGRRRLLYMPGGLQVSADQG